MVLQTRKGDGFERLGKKQAVRPPGKAFRLSLRVSVS